MEDRADGGRIAGKSVNAVYLGRVEGCYPNNHALTRLSPDAFG